MPDIPHLKNDPVPPGEEGDQPQAEDSEDGQESNADG